MIHRKLPFHSYGTAAILLLALAGCGDSGPELASVSGTVTLDGQPLQYARLEFQPDMPGMGSPSYGETDKEGRYVLHYTTEKMGAMVGTHVVRIRTEGEITTDEDVSMKVPERLPAKYNKESELTGEVQKGDNTINFDLSSSASR